MPECPNLSTCPMLLQTSKMMPAVAALVRQHICQKRFGECARFRVCMALGKEAVPLDLDPSQQERATKLISEGLAKMQVRRPGLVPNAA